MITLSVHAEHRAPESWHQSFTHSHRGLFTEMLEAGIAPNRPVTPDPSRSAEENTNPSAGAPPATATNAQPQMRAPLDDMKSFEMHFENCFRAELDTTRAFSATAVAPSRLSVQDPPKPALTESRSLAEPNRFPSPNRSSASDLVLVIACNGQQIVVSARAVGIGGSRLAALQREIAAQITDLRLVLTGLTLNGNVYSVGRADGERGRDG